ncbi:uncharacterized protein EDB91DRAFT_1243307 [Suillus paluster]|uniref:uncharacterized protein n=1 Tax=Suillus paluster TaxID=48578 RepID=UPI001B868C80|nr:uncharacterized protein EDB91DRAFT_1243307 [Suillus paluster]KAG1752548.1 hypothetical protein EDB91DRAFT_1243307 [Suillus paluster]
MQIADPHTIMRDLMEFAIAIIKSMLAVPESIMYTIPHDAIKEGRWIEAWECLLKTFASFDKPYLDSPLLHDTKPVNDDSEYTSKDASATQIGMPEPDDQEFPARLNFNASGIQIQDVSMLLDAGCAFASPSDAHERLAFVFSPETSTAFQPLSCTNDMSGGLEAKPDESVPEQPLVDSHLVCEEEIESVGSHPFVCSCLICEEDRENDTLLELRLDGRNIVLDSLYPHIAPHIVITPPVSYADDFYIPNHNRVDPQWPCFLNVHRLPPHIFYHHYPLSSSHGESADCDSGEFQSQSLASSDDYEVIPPQTPPRVFSHKRLLLAVEASSTERLVFREIVDGVLRHRLKAVAFEASLSATAACARFNNSGAVSALEQPEFVWTDCAQHILLASRYSLGISIIESDNPFRAPHIMITAAEPHDPWISWSNRLEDQDYDYLPSLPQAKFSIESDYSRETDLINTPLSLDDSRYFLTPHETWEMGPDPDHAYPTSEFNTLDKMSVGLSIIRCETPEPGFDDEDDLPPFDDWYLSVIERSKVIGT